MEPVTHSLVIPVYKNYSSLPNLLEAILSIERDHGSPIEFVFVVDGSPDSSFQWLKEALPARCQRSQLISHSRNFGSFAAIRTGLSYATGQYFAVMSADLQEPPELVTQFFQSLSKDTVDVVLGSRDSRDDPFLSQLTSKIFWAIYRRFIQPEMPIGGIDMFGCNILFREKLLSLNEHNGSLVGLILWLGFRRKTIGYHRRAREHGKSAWTLRKKINYLLDSIFAFSDLPLKILMGVGGIGVIAALFIGLYALVGKLTGQIQVPGYTMLIITVVFFGALNTFALGVVGSYVWRAFENTKQRPLAVVSEHFAFQKKL
jgi:glycosyltransferase involved in cell wall biosynthesis